MQVTGNKGTRVYPLIKTFSVILYATGSGKHEQYKYILSYITTNL